MVENLTIQEDISTPIRKGIKFTLIDPQFENILEDLEKIEDFPPIVEKRINISKPTWLDEGIVDYFNVACSETHIKRVYGIIEMYSTFKPDESDYKQ